MKKIILITIAILITLLLVNRGVLFKKSSPITSGPSQLTIISTTPNPLDGATILPTQNLEFTLNRPLFRSQFKHRFDPEVEHEVEVVGDKDKEFGSTFKIIFKKPLELGSGYTLFILNSTHDEAKITLDHEYVYHFSTIKYRGI